MTCNVVSRIALCVAVSLFSSTTSHARDLGQWDDPANADLKRWFQDLKQPDNPTATCCGEADAYWADAFEATSDGEYVAINVYYLANAAASFGRTQGAPPRGTY